MGTREQMEPDSIRSVIKERDARKLDMLLYKLGREKGPEELRRFLEVNGETPLHFCCRMGSSASIADVLLRWGDDVSLRSTKGARSTPLLLACAHGDAQLCDFLIAKGADVDDVDSMEETVLHAACKNKDINVLRTLLENHRVGYLVNHRDKLGSFPLQLSCNTGTRTVEAASLLLDHGANVNMAGTFEGWTPLHSACRYNKPALVALLLERGANPSLTESANGEYALTKAAENGLVEVVQILLQSRNHTVDALWNGALMAATQRKTQVLEMILDALDEKTLNDALVLCLKAIYHGNRRDLIRIINRGGKKIENNVTLTRLLLMAAASGQCEVIAQLVRGRGTRIDIDAQDEAGLSALHLASYASHSECVRELVGAGADVNITDRCQKSPLLHASFGSSFADPEKCHSVLETLLKSGAEPNARSVSTAPLHRIAMTGSTEHIKLLCQFGASLTLTNVYGRCPLDVAWREDLSSMLHDIYSQYQNRDLGNCLNTSKGIHPSHMEQLKIQWVARTPSTVTELCRLVMKKDDEVSRKLLEISSSLQAVNQKREDVDTLVNALNVIEGRVEPNSRQNAVPPAARSMILPTTGIQQKCYTMTAIPRGFAIVINNWKFAKHRDRQGYEVDNAHLKKLFEFLEFDYINFENEDAETMVKKLERISGKSSLAQHNAFILVILSHGSEGLVRGSDDKEVPLQRIFSLFSNKNCKDLIGKPKLFIIQACRGGTVDHGVVTDGSAEQSIDPLLFANGLPRKCKNITSDDNVSGVLAPTHDWSNKQGICLDGATPAYKPSFSDTYLIQPNTQGFAAFRCAHTGSSLIRTIVQVFMEKARTTSIFEMMIEVTQILSDEVFMHNGRECKMCPDTASTLTKSLFFFQQLCATRPSSYTAGNTTTHMYQPVP